MKRLLLSLTVLFTTLCVSASEYIYTSTGRYLVERELDVVQPGSGWNNYSASLYSAYKAETEDDFDGIQSVTSDEGMFISNAIKLADYGGSGSYIVTFSFLSFESGTSTITDGSLNQIDAWLSAENNQGQRVGTVNINYQQVASTFNYTAGDWTTVSWFFTDTLTANLSNGSYLNILFSRINVDAIIASNLKVTKVSEAYDTRIAQKQLDFIRQLMADPNFDTEAAQDNKEELEGLVDIVQGMIDSDDEAFDTEQSATEMLEALSIAYEDFLGVESSDLNEHLEYIDFSTYGTKIDKTNPNTFGAIRLNEGGRWAHGANDEMLYCSIQKNNDFGHHTMTIVNTSFPAGKYFFTGEVRYANCPSNAWTFTYETEGVGGQAYIGENIYELGTLPAGEEWTKFYFIGDIEDGNEFKAGFYFPAMEKAENTRGTCWQIRKLDIRGFGNPEEKIARQDAWNSFITQWNAAKNARTAMIAKGDDKEYPWGKDTISITQNEWDPIYNRYDNVWVDEDGKDLKAATIEELKAFGDGSDQGYTPTEEEIAANSWKTKYALARAYDYANKYIIAHNQPIADLKASIANAEATRDDAMNVNGDKDTYQTAIDAAKNLFNDILEKTTDATMEADTASINKQLAALADAKEVFLNSSEIPAIVDIDFSNGWTDITDSEEPDRVTAYAIEGAKGKMEFGLSAINKDNTAGGNVYNLGYADTNTDVLRVGSTDATVDFSADAPTDDEILRVEFDFYFGNLSGKNAYVKLCNAAGTKVGGFSMNRYNGTVEYNDFNNAENTGMDILAYTSGVGAQNVDNNAICVENNKTHFTLLFDYKAQSLIGTVSNPQKGTCEGVEVPMLNLIDETIEDNKAVKFVLGSNYATDARRCWFDNLVIKKYASNAEGFAWTVIDAPTSATAATPVAYYTLSGAQTTAAQKGIVIVKYSDGSVKKIYNK